jgi:hypothetical protein
MVFNNQIVNNLIWLYGYYILTLTIVIRQVDVTPTSRGRLQGAL